MTDDPTTLLSPPPPVWVRVLHENMWAPEIRFTETFRIGRSPECQVQVQERAVSKLHAEVRFEGGTWSIFDLGSANGLYLNGRRVAQAPLTSGVKIELGRGGPVLWFAVGDHAGALQGSDGVPFQQKDVGSVTEIVDRLRRRRKPDEEGDDTRNLREALQRITKQHSRKYKVVLAFVGILLVIASGFGLQQYLKVQALKATASEIFYSMKQHELKTAQLEEMIIETKNMKLMQEILAERQTIKEEEARYDRFIAELGIYQKGMSEQERAVYRVARLFGECETAMPPGFYGEVQKYIKKWKSTARLVTSIRRAEKNGYIHNIANAMLARNLPPQFFYLALQESGFDPQAVGPKTRFGYAKGVWQFVPTTAELYGLRTGPLKELGRYDPKDERYNFQKATEAAAKYLKRLYTTDAQASGLLVMASYNWGEGNVIGIIRKMPKNPKERNFWELLKQHKIPQETYDYVFYIISAAVIAENPKLFGFDFDNPFPHAVRR